MVWPVEERNYRRSGLLSLGRYISCLANAKQRSLAGCVSLALDSVNVAPSTHHLQPTTAQRSTPRPCPPPTTKCSTSRARGSLFLPSKFMPAYQNIT
jgi:hypothetical protein